MINIISNLSTFEFVDFTVLLISLLVQIFYYIFVYGKVSFGRIREIDNDTQKGISVIICAKNEEENLKKFLPTILNQNYPNYEVIIVNDCSTDNTEILLADLEKTYKNLRHTNIEYNPNFSHSKKLAVSIGIKSAKHERLVFTDADCYAETDKWLQIIANQYHNNKTEIVLGYGKYETKKGFLNKLIRFDTMMIALQYFGMAKRKKAYMGVGRNLSYKKSLFLKGKGFSSHYHILSGDDDLFVNQHTNKQNTSIVVYKDSFTCSVPSSTFKQWIKQKKRHLSVGHLYKKSDKFRLILEPLSKMFFYLSIISILFTPYYLLGIAVYFFRLFMQMIVIKSGMKKLNEHKLLLLIPVFDIILPILNLSLLKSAKKTTKNKKWR